MDYSFSIYSVYKFLFGALILFVILRALFYVLPIIAKRSERQKKIIRILPFIEFVSWIFFLIWAFNYFLKDNQILAFILFVLALVVGSWATWFFMKDYITGVFIKTGKNIMLDETVTIGKYSGKIIRFNMRTVCLELDSGRHIEIQYSKVAKAEVIREGREGKVSGNMLIIPVTKKQSLNSTISELKSIILNLPWVSLKNDPVIKLKRETEKEYEFEIMIFSISDDYIYRIKDHLKSHFHIER